MIVIDPLLCMFKKHIEDKGLGVIRACADDVGVALKNFRDIVFFNAQFDKFSKMSGLCLNPKRCVIILTCFVASESNIETVRMWLSLNCPA